MTNYILWLGILLSPSYLALRPPGCLNFVCRIGMLKNEACLLRREAFNSSL